MGLSVQELNLPLFLILGAAASDTIMWLLWLPMLLIVGVTQQKCHARRKENTHVALASARALGGAAVVSARANGRPRVQARPAEPFLPLGHPPEGRAATPARAVLEYLAARSPALTTATCGRAGQSV